MALQANGGLPCCCAQLANAATQPLPVPRSYPTRDSLLPPNTVHLLLRRHIAIDLDVEEKQQPVERRADRIPLTLLALHAVWVPRRRHAVHPRRHRPMW